MNTEKNKDSRADLGSLIGDFSGHRPPSFFPVLQLCQIFARREEFPRSAAVCAEHQPQQVGRMGRRWFQRVPAGIRGRCGWSSADTAALLGLRLRRFVFIASPCSSRRFPSHRRG